ncbi:transposase|uniref:REP element-mobilizing transposase RayT n=1 Tax=Dendrosporobacter quercicolus TaxID=146817 RepID=A0A1G9U5S1_9FIRM|nr:transposase [Dendrosporobacter quercicolus]NSL48746.1 transposase [Dendrosporobacter quercicolus DSM 1736]SDM55306.1 REP element-mobilizing transposase RayT [Dendrosporobacter quercicolus]
MSRQARQKSESGIYHIIVRGINKQVIFEDDEDREKFIGYLQYYKDIASYLLYGYCLMDNHIHLLIKEGKESIGNTMKRIGVSYVSWYNRKYDRAGHLFQDRFKSEVVETDEYLLTVLRYIHQNPVKAGKEKSVEIYKWSSYAEYIGKSKIIETGFILGIFAEEREKFIVHFQNYMNEYADANCIEINEKKRMSDDKIKKIIQKYAKVKMPTELQNMEKTKRDEIVRKIKEMNGISTRQIARLTGMSQSVIAKA